MTTPEMLRLADEIEGGTRVMNYKSGYEEFWLSEDQRQLIITALRRASQPPVDREAVLKQCAGLAKKRARQCQEMDFFTASDALHEVADAILALTPQEAVTKPSITDPSGCGHDHVGGMTTPPRGAGAGSFDALRIANTARQKEWDPSSKIDLAYRGNELAGEIGEACNVIKKLVRERLGIGGSRATVAQLAEELADGVICIDLIAMSEGIDLWASVASKFNATSEKVGLQTRLSASTTDTKPAGGAGAPLTPYGERLREALEKIAAFDDAYGNLHLERSSTYAGFDEPQSVKIARAALAGEPKP